MKTAIITLIIAALLGLSTLALAHGVRNNNPGNIRAGIDVWKGQVGVDSDGFVIFDTIINGFRAMYKTLLTYRRKYDLNTIAGIITRWAPPESNNTSAYIAKVSQRLGIKPDAPLNLSDYPTLMLAIAKQETGRTYNLTDAKTGVSLS